PSDSRNDRASPAKTRGGWRRSSTSAASSAAGSGQSGCCSAGRERQLAGSQSETGSNTGLIPTQGSEVGARGALAPTALDRAALAHLLELALRLGLLGEERGLDAVEESFEPADELGLRDAQLR